MTTEIHGSWSSRFRPVVEEFLRNFAERGEVGAALSVFIEGTLEVDVWAGWADVENQLAWQRDTLVNVYSAAKPVIAVNLLQLIDRGLIGLDDPIVSVWPEFAVHDKQRATVRHALCHRAGVPAIRRDLTNDDLWKWDVMCEALAESEPYFEPGSRHIYHTNTYGHLVGEITRRVSGEEPATALAAMAKLLDADIHVGLTSEEQRRCATVYLAFGAPTQTSQSAPSSNTSDDTSNMIRRGYFNPPGYSSFGVVNSPEWRHAQIPSTNMHATARGLARWYVALLGPSGLLSSELLRQATAAQSSGFCPVLGEHTVFGLGFKPTSAQRPFGTNASSLGHFGTGGAVGFADPSANVAFAYVMNHVIPRWQSSRNRALIDSLYGVLNQSTPPPNSKR